MFNGRLIRFIRLRLIRLIRFRLMEVKFSVLPKSTLCFLTFLQRQESCQFNFFIKRFKQASCSKNRGSGNLQKHFLTLGRVSPNKNKK